MAFKRRDRSLSIFSLSALDMFAMAMGSFVLMAVVLMPYYRRNFDAMEAIKANEAASAVQQAQADTVLLGAAADAASAAQFLSEADNAAKAAAELQAAAASLLQQADAVEGQAGKAQKLVGRMKATTNQKVIQELDLVFIVDTTGSMVEVLRDIGLSMGGIVRVLEKMVPSVRVGFVAYRDYDVRSWLTKPLPLTATNGRGLRKVLSFAESLQPAVNMGGKTPTEAVYSALQDAVKFNFRPSAKQTLILIGDAAAHRTERKQLSQLLANFLRGHKNRSVSTLFVTTDSYRRFGTGDRDWYKQLAHYGKGQFNDHSGSLIGGILLSVLDE